MRSDPEPFRCDVAPAGDRRLVVRPVGELDIATVPSVDKRLRRARTDGYEELVLDLREVAFLDSSGLRLILEWNDLAARDGCSFALIRGRDSVQRVFHATRVTDRLTFEDPA